MRPGWSKVAASLVFAAQTVHAQTNAVADQRRRLIAEAQASSERGDHVGALDLAGRAASLGMSTSLRVFITEEQEAIGRWVDAYANATACLHDADSDASLVNREGILGACRELLATARGRVAWLVVHVPAADAGATVRVRINGQPVAREALSSPYPCEPGPAMVEASIANQPAVRRDVTLRPGANTEVTFAAPMPSDAVTASIGTRDNRRRPREHSLGPYFVAGAGAAGLIAAGVLFGLRQMAQGNCDLEGRALVCPTEADAERARSAITYNVAVDVALGVGLAAVAAGTVWWIVDRRPPERRSPSAMLVPLSGGAMATIGGRL